MTHLKLEQRYAIKAFLKCGKSKDEIANELGVDRSTIYREIARNSRKGGVYSPDFAQELANEKKERFCKHRKFDSAKEHLVEDWIRTEQWSPEQISGYCKAQGIEMVSHERIYQYIRDDKFSGGDLYRHTRHRLKHRNKPVGKDSEIIKDKVSIEERSQIIEDKMRVGDWEIDLIVGKDNKGAIVTIVERKTSMLMMKKLKHGKNADGLAKTVIDMLRPYKEYVKSITSDNGTEFARHKKIAKALNTEFFFAHPYASWERGLSEYTNKLIRQYIPKKSDFGTVSDQYIKEVQHKINRRPRKILNFKRPKNLFYHEIA